MLRNLRAADPPHADSLMSLSVLLASQLELLCHQKLLQRPTAQQFSTSKASIGARGSKEFQQTGAAVNMDAIAGFAKKFAM